MVQDTRDNTGHEEIPRDACEHRTQSDAEMQDTLHIQHTKQRCVLCVAGDKRHIETKDKAYGGAGQK